MSLSLILYLFIGGAVGAALAYAGKCSAGSCVLIANWRRGAVVGAGLGLAAFLASGAGGNLNESTANVNRIGQAEFEAEVVQSSLPVLVDFYAAWCAPCKVLSPRVEKIAGEFTGTIKVVKVNVDESPVIAQRFGIAGLPTLMVFKDGKVVDTMIGLQSEAALRSRLEAVAKENSAAPQQSSL
jgi:thioredoxin 1